MDSLYFWKCYGDFPKKCPCVTCFYEMVYSHLRKVVNNTVCAWYRLVWRFLSSTPKLIGTLLILEVISCVRCKDIEGCFIIEVTQVQTHSDGIRPASYTDCFRRLSRKSNTTPRHNGGPPSPHQTWIIRYQRSERRIVTGRRRVASLLFVQQLLNQGW